MLEHVYPAPFVVGAGRSGTTLLRMMLDAHPDLAIPPETRFVPRLINAARGGRASADDLAGLLAAERNWADFGLDAKHLAERFRKQPRLDPATVVRSFYHAYAERFGKSRWGDKTPPYGRRAPMIASAVPEAHFVHVVRDPRAVVASWLEFRAGRGDDPLTPAHWAEVWVATVVETRVKAQRVERFTEIRYEDLVTDPEPTLRRICDFIDLPFAGEMLSYHETAAERLAELSVGLPAGREQPARSAADRIGPHELLAEPPRLDRIESWRNALTPSESRAVEEVARDLLADLGYSAG
ncbi:MAG: sulfotransferase [Actinomycetota bacterium]|nr:sulfotransferase [Actinomycetota bacterium]